MSYIQKNLSNGEQIIYESKLSLYILLPGLIFIIIGMLFYRNEGLSTLLYLIGGIIIFKGTLNLLTSEFAITNRRIFIKTGWLKKDTRETLIKEIEGTQIAQGMIQGMVKCGTIIITGTGGSNIKIKNIDNPLEFRKNVLEQININK